MRNFWLLISVLWLWTCSGGGGSSPTEPQEPAPVSNFTATPTTLIQGQSVTFTSTSTGTITSYAWNVDADPEIEGATSTYTHTYSDVGTYSVVLTVTGPGGSNSKTVADMIIVSSAAPTPTTETSQTVQEDGSTTISLTATDPNGQAVTFAITTDPTNGTATLSGTEITYTPNANFYGTDSFDYTASNGTYTSDPVTITITVEGEDDGNPTTNDVSATTDEDTVVTVNLDATEIDGDNYSFSIISQPSNGTLGSINGNQVEYTPNQDWNGTDTFTFEATDDRTYRRNVATATIIVNAVNDAPVANDITSQVTDENRAMQLDITLDATDVEGDALTYSIIGTNNGTVTVNGSTATYTPNQDWNGEDTFTYKANDGNLDSNTATVTVTVNSVNDAPVTEDQSASTNEDTAVTITLSVVDVDTQQGMTRSIVSSPSNGSVVLTGSGNQTATYTPTTNWNGTDTFTWKANDGELDSNVSTVTITVAAVNDAPTTEDVSTTIDENLTASRSTGITLQGSDVDGDNLTYTVVSGPSNGNASIAGSILTYAANQDWNGTETITYKANDGTVDSNTSTVTITINSINDAPVTQNVSFTTDEDTPYTESYTGYVSDVEGDNLTITAVTNPTNGTATCDGTDCTYTPNQDFNGTDSFTYKVNDGELDSNVSTVTITVTAVNDAPVANDVSTTIDENRFARMADLALDATDVDGDALTYILVSNPSNGTASVSGSTLTYNANQDWNGTETFTYKANDGTADSNTATITITVNAINDTPVVIGTDEKNSKSIDFDKTSGGSGYHLYDSPSRDNGTVGNSLTTAMTLQVWAKPEQIHDNMYVVGKGDKGSLGSGEVFGFGYRPDTETNKWTAEFHTDTEYLLTSSSDIMVNEWVHLVLTFEGNDIKFYVNGTLEKTQSLRTSANTVANGANGALNEDFRIGGYAANNEDYNNFDGNIDAPALWNIALSSSQISNLYNSGNGLSATEVSPSNLIGYWNFEGNMNDLTSLGNDLYDSKCNASSDCANYVSTVPGQYNTPLTASTNEDILSLEISLVGTDVDGDNLTYSIVTNPSNGTVSISGSTATYIPSSNYNGNDSFVYKANDGTVDSANRTVFIEIAAVNDVPTTSAVSVSTNEDTAKAITLVGADVDTGDTLTYSIVSNPSNGSLGSVSGSGVTYTPTANWNGTDTFTFKANDGTADSNTSTVTITVAAVNDAPVANDMSLSLNRGSSTDFTLDAIDPDGDILSKTIVSQPDNGTLSPGIGLNYTYTPTNSLFFGADSLTYKVNDGNLDSDIKTIGFTINEVLKMYGDENTKTFGIARSTQNSTYLIATDDDNDFSIYEIDDSLALINKSTKTTNSANVSNFFNNASTDGGEIGNNSIIVTSKVSDVVVFDKQMNIIFDSVLKDITGGAGFGFVVYDSKELSNGNFLFAGSHWNPNEYPYVLILDSSGNKISDHYFDNGALQATFFTTFLELSDGSYFATSSNGNVNFPLMKLDSEFNILWLDTTDDEVHDSLEINNTIFYTCAYDMGDGMIRARSPIDGSILWSVGLENTTSRDVFLRLHSSGDLIVASGHNYLARITQNGSKVWEKSYDYITFEKTGNLSNQNENKNFVEDEEGNLIILNTTKAHRSYGGALFKVDFNDGTKLLP